MENDRECLFLTRATLPSPSAHVTFSLKMADALLDAGLSLTFIHPFRWRNRNFNPDEARKNYGLTNRLPFRCLPSLDFPVVSSISPKLWFWIYTASYLVSVLIYVIRKKFSKEQFYIYSTDFPLSFMLTFVKSWLKVPVFLEVHDVPESFSDWRKTRLQQLDGFVVNGPGIKNKLLEEGFDESKILVAYNGINLDDYRLNHSKRELRDELNLPSQDYLVVFTGNPYDYNGIRTILSLADRASEITYLCVGGTEDRITELKERLTPSQDRNLILRSHESPSRMPRYQRTADCLLAPLTNELTRTELYATPMKVFEYMAAKRPIVASDLPSIRHLLTHEETALLCEADRPQQFEQTIQRLRQNPDLAESLAEAAGNEASNYTWERRADKVMAFLEDRVALNSPGG